MRSREKNLDMTTGSIWRNMVAFAVPVFLGQLFQQLYNTADSIITPASSHRRTRRLVWVLVGSIVCIAACLHILLRIL